MCLLRHRDAGRRHVGGRGAAVTRHSRNVHRIEYALDDVFRLKLPRFGLVRQQYPVAQYIGSDGHHVVRSDVATLMNECMRLCSECQEYGRAGGCTVIYERLATGKCIDAFGVGLALLGGEVVAFLHVLACFIGSSI
jgi:hypothetical protein